MTRLALIIISSQALFTFSDVLARQHMKATGFTTTAFLSQWFIWYNLSRLVAALGQLYVFSQLELGRTLLLFAVISLIIANIIGYLLLGEVLTFYQYIGMMFAILAFILVIIGK